MADQPNYYDLLQLPSNASVEDIRRAYRTLAKTVHPDASADSDATRQFQLLQVAYETLIEPRSRALYDVQQAELAMRAERLAAFSVRLLASHRQLGILPEAQAMYVLADIKATSTQAPRRPTINLCLALDRSLSMEGERLQRAQDAACFLIDQLSASDVVSIVAFSDRARVVLDGFMAADRHVARESVRMVQARGGTELLQGLNLGIEQLRKWRTAETVEQLILLTDGNTYGDEAGCIESAALAGREKIGMTLLGLGSEWNDHLLDEMAARSGGYASFVDSPSKLTAVFQQRLGTVLNLAARDLQVAMHVHSSARVEALYRLTPDIVRLPLGDNSARLGILDYNQPIRLLVELRVEGREPGPLRAMRLTVSGDSVLRPDSARETVHADTNVMISPAPSAVDVPRDLEDVLARLAVFKVQEKAMSEVERGDHKRATTRLQNLATHLMSFGEVELARATLLEAGELARTGQLSPEGRKRIRYGTRKLGSTSPLGSERQ